MKPLKLPNKKKDQKSAARKVRCLFPVPVPRILKERSRYWTSEEIGQILKLQEYLQRQDLNIRPRDFTRLWYNANGKCEITGQPFFSTDKFDVGIERINKDQPFSLRNSRLVLLPLSYSRVRAGVYSLTTGPVGKTFKDRMISRAIVMNFVEAARNHPLSRTCPVDVTFRNPEPSYALCRGRAMASDYFNADLLIKVWVFPITRWYKRVERGDNLKRVMSLAVDTDSQKIVISGIKPREKGDRWDNDIVRYKSDTRNLDLCDPTIDYIQHFLEVYQTSLITTMAYCAIETTKNWNYD